MGVVRAADISEFELMGNHMRGLATPSRGAAEVAVWRGVTEPGATTPPHKHDHEEVLVVRVHGLAPKKVWAARYQAINAFERLRDKNRGKPKWSFLDGPITANNPMGVHHAWGRTYKDAYQRYFAMTGHEERYQNGFDCQGLWVEVEVEKELGLKSKRDIEELVPGDRFASIDKFVSLCKQRVDETGTALTLSCPQRKRARNVNRGRRTGTGRTANGDVSGRRQLLCSLPSLDTPADAQIPGF